MWFVASVHKDRDQVENPELSHSKDGEYVEIELDIEIDDEESNDDDEFLSENDSDDEKAEENPDPQAKNERRMPLFYNKTISVKLFGSSVNEMRRIQL